MPVSVREQCLEAFYERLKEIVGVRTVARNPNYEIASSAMPAIVQRDGSDVIAEPQFTGILVIDTQVNVWIGIQALQSANVGVEINAMLAKVQKIIGDDPSLSGLAVHCLYDGCDEPQLLEEEGAAPIAYVDTVFLMRRQQSETDPYAFA